MLNLSILICQYALTVTGSQLIGPLYKASSVPPSNSSPSRLSLFVFLWGQNQIPLNKKILCTNDCAELSPGPIKYLKPLNSQGFPWILLDQQSEEFTRNPHYCAK